MVCKLWCRNSIPERPLFIFSLSQLLSSIEETVASGGDALDFLMRQDDDEDPDWDEEQGEAGDEVSNDAAMTPSPAPQNSEQEEEPKAKDEL